MKGLWRSPVSAVSCMLCVLCECVLCMLCRTKATISQEQLHSHSLVHPMLALIRSQVEKGTAEKHKYKKLLYIQSLEKQVSINAHICVECEESSLKILNE